jgi:hypothetical protein
MLVMKFGAKDMGEESRPAEKVSGNFPDMRAGLARSQWAFCI